MREKIKYVHSALVMAKMGPITTKQKYKKCSWSVLLQKKGIVMRQLLEVFSFDKKLLQPYTKRIK